LPQQPDSEMTK